MEKIPSRRYPSTMALRCFEASARLQSFTSAAQVLNMTQSAVSKQIAQLEDTLNTTLFDRSFKGLSLTPSGKLFLSEAQNILNQIEVSVLNMLAYDNNTITINIASHPTLSARWLIPILKDFNKIYPQIYLDIKEQIDSIEIENHQTDIAFLYGDGMWRDMTSFKLFEEKCVAVCCPTTFKQAFDKIENFNNYTLIQSHARPRAWDEYFQMQNFTNDQSFIGPRFDTFYSCIHAAIFGYGIALVPKFLVEKELISGELILVWPYEMNTLKAYYMSYSTSITKTTKVQTLVQWVKDHLIK